MAKFSGEYEETFTVNVPVDDAKAQFLTLENIAATFGRLERWEKVDDKTIRLFMLPREGAGVTFHGHYRCRYEFVGPNRLEWKTVGDDNNMWTRGWAEFSAQGPERAQVRWWGHTEMDMEINRLMAKMAGPFISQQISSGSQKYLENVRKAIYARTGRHS